MGPAAAMTQAEKGDAENGKEKGGEKEKEQRGVKRPIVPALVPESLQEVRRRGRGSQRAGHPSSDVGCRGGGGGLRADARGCCGVLVPSGSLRAGSSGENCGPCVRPHPPRCDPCSPAPGGAPGCHLPPELWEFLWSHVEFSTRPGHGEYMQIRGKG